jgi:hypothetical protein
MSGSRDKSKHDAKVKHNIRRLFEADLGADDLGVGAHRRGGEIYFAYPILVVVGEKPV